MEKAAFTDYFTNTITRELKIDLEKDVTTIKINLTLSTLKPIHAIVMTEIYQHFNKDEQETILNGWKAAGVVHAVEEGRSGVVIDFNPFF